MTDPTRPGKVVGFTAKPVTEEDFSARCAQMKARPAGVDNTSAPSDEGSF